MFLSMLEVVVKTWFCVDQPLLERKRVSLIDPVLSLHYQIRVCLMLVHIDDILIVGSRKTALEEFIPSLQAKYTVSIEIMSGPGDEVTFLKKTHQLLEERWKEGYSNPSQTFGSALQVASFVETFAEQTLSWSQ